MESNKETVFDIVSGDDIVIAETIERYNQTYETDFKVVDYEDRDGVVFAWIGTTAGTDHIFNLGYFFGMNVQQKRDRKELDW